MIRQHFKHEAWFYVLAFLLGLGLRFVQLGAMPLSDPEALAALQSLHLSQGLHPALAAHPFYILSTSVLFFLFGGGTNFLARFLPALAGSLLVLVPLFQQRIKPRPAVLLAFFLAVDPGLVAISRQAASPVFAILFLSLTWVFYERRRPGLTGFFAALALLGGPALWPGLLGLALAWSILAAFKQAALPANPFDWKAFGLSLGSTLLIAGTLFTMVPNGLSAALSSIPAWFSGWTAPQVVSPVRVLASLAIYQPLALVLALVALARAFTQHSRLLISTLAWFFISLLLALVYPARQVTDLAWVLLPLSILAALELVRHVHIFPDERLEIGGVVLLTVFIWTFAWLDLSKTNWVDASSREYVLRFWLLLGAFLLLFFSLLLVASGWSIRTARTGGLLGLGIVLGVFGLGGALGSTGLRGTAFPEMWWPGQVPGQAVLLQSAVDDLSDWGMGNARSAPVVIQGIDSPALEWLLREHPVSETGSIDTAGDPAFIITTDQQQNNPVLSSGYRGQVLAWRQTPAWTGTPVNGWVRWLTTRVLAQSNETIVLWARDDLFPDSSTRIP